MKKTLPVDTAPFSNEYAMNTLSVHTALLKTMLAGSLLNRDLSGNAQGRRNRGARGAMAPPLFDKLCNSAPSKSKNAPSKSII